ncbi:MAG: stage II sporulation protein P [Lachnospira sp.]|nr:stage II sporulation protein P [Lachnospira sp.]
MMYRKIFIILSMIFVFTLLKQEIYEFINPVGQALNRVSAPNNDKKEALYACIENLYCGNSYVVSAYQKPKSYKDPLKIDYQNVSFDAATFFAKEETENVVTMNRIGRIYSYEEITDFDFLYSNFFTVASVTSLNAQRYDVKKLLETNLSIQKDSNAPQILIFHTHSQETFVDSDTNDTDTSIIGVGNTLAKHLEDMGYNVLHDTSNYDIVNGVLDRSKAYTYANEAIKKHLEKYPSIEVILDIHRDGVPDDKLFVTEIEGKKMAKIMLFNGISYTNINGEIDYLKNENLDANLATSLQMQLLAEAYYPDLMRKMYIHGYRYCLHHRGRSMLVEVGAQNNTIEEAKNAMLPFAITLDKLLSGEKIIE